MRQVPFFNYPLLFSEQSDAYMATFQDVLSRGAYIMQKDLAQFEQNLASYLGCKHVIGVADGTVALTLSLKAAGIGPGDEVIVSTHTFVATAAAVHHVGATPVVADCLPDSMIDPASVRRLITSKTRAIMPTQLNGRTCDMPALLSICAEFGLKLVEDSCQALGASYDGTKAGLFGVAGSYSFYPAKTLGSFGDGGAIATNDDEAAEFIRLMRDHGRGADGKVRQFGHNGRLDNIQAAVLDLKLKTYDQAIARRRAIASLYQARLGGMPEVLLPPAPGSDAHRFDVFQNYEIQVEYRSGLREHLSAQGVGTIIQWGGWMLHQFDDLGLVSDVTYGQGMTQRYMMLPLHHMLSDDDVHYVCDSIESFYGSKRSATA